MFAEPIEQMAGDDLGVYAGMWRQYSEELLFAQEILLHIAITKTAKTPEEISVLRESIPALNQFLAECLAEVERKKSESEADLKKG